jgi:exopolyphosphatase/guanosine-5'-triphosphate,3'-diphosphate pyrophosphatase
MKLSSVKTLAICPWVLREGILLRYLEDGAEWWTDIERHDSVSRLNGATARSLPLRAATPSPAP